MPDQPITGSCLCGNLAYEVDIPPLSVWMCHCSDCQDATNSDYQLTVLFQADRFRQTAGKAAIWHRKGDSGRDLKIHFCPECGARAFYHIDGGEGSAIMFAPAGTLDQKQWIQPVANLWTKSRRPWVTLEESWLQFETQPEGEGFVPLFNAYEAWWRGAGLAA